MGYNMLWVPRATPATVHTRLRILNFID